MNEFVLPIKETRVCYNFNIKMSKEKGEKIARKLFQECSASSNTKENIQDHKILHQKTTFELLKDSIQTQQKLRVKNKYQRTIKSKESELEDIVKKCNNLQLVLKREKGLNQGLIAEKQHLTQVIEKLNRQISQKQMNLKHALHSKAKLEQQNAKLKAEGKEILKKKVDAQAQSQKLRKQFGLASKKEKQALNDKIEKLQAKLRIKQKQQQKIQAILKQKANEYEEIVRSKQEEIVFLQSEYTKLKEQNQQIAHDIWQIQTKEKEIIHQFDEQIQQLTGRLREIEKTKQLRQVQQQAGLQKFKALLGLQTEKTEFVGQLQDFSAQLKTRQQHQQQLVRIQQLQRELQKCRAINKQSISKNQILEEELLFLKREKAKNNEFESAFRSHLTSMSEQLLVKDIKKDEGESKPLMARTINFQPFKEVKTHNLQDQQFLSVQLKERDKEQNNSGLRAQAKAKQQIGLVSEAIKKKSASDFLKQQLSSKKKSLIYIMYKHKEEQEFIKRQAIKTPAPTQILQKRRSNSLGSLISAKCKSQLL